MPPSFSTVNTLPLPQAAFWYGLNGFKIFPLHPNAKIPLVRWSEKATDDLIQINEWWKSYPNANIGLVMGGKTSALDIDCKAGQRGWESYLAAGGSVFVPQPVQITPSGGRHILFNHPRDFRNFVGQGQFGGLDMRSAGGYIAAAPSVIDGTFYRWVDGNPDLPLPDQVLDSLETWSSRTSVRRVVDVKMPVPTDLMDWEIHAMIADLGERHAAWLLEGITGFFDNSRAAFAACVAAFKRGWSLADMAAVGPHTLLAYFGQEPPHGARNPWEWAWKYTVTAAWEVVEADRERLSPEKMFSPVGEPEEIGDEPARAYEPEEMFEPLYDWLDPVPAPEPVDPWRVGPAPAPAPERERKNPREVGPAPAPARDTYETLCIAAATLAERDLRQVQNLVLRAFKSGLRPDEIDALLTEIKRYSKYPMGMLRDMVQRVRKETSSDDRAERDKPDAIWILDQNKMLDVQSGSLITRESFLAAHARDYGGMQEAQEAFFVDPRTSCPVVTSLTYNPGMAPGIGVDLRGVVVYNAYRPGGVMPVPGDVTPWLDLLRSLNLEGDEESERLLLDRLAFMVQSPGGKFQHGILLGGAHGIGKDSFLAPVLKILGERNVNVIHGSELNSDFNAWMAGAKLVVVNEVDYGDHKDRRSISEVLKPALASPPSTLRVNEKNLRPYSIPNTIQVIGMTNHRGALYLDEGERRWLALWTRNNLKSMSPELRERWDEYFTAYWSWLEAGGTEAIHAYLLARDIRAFNPNARPPETEWLMEMMRQSRDPLESIILEGLASGLGIWGEPIIDAEIVLHDIALSKPQMFGDRLPTLKQVERTLDRVGIPHKRIEPQYLATDRRAKTVNPMYTQSFYFPTPLKISRGWSMELLPKLKKLRIRYGLPVNISDFEKRKKERGNDTGGRA